MRVNAGFGDPDTWERYTGHPNDPRHDDSINELIDEEQTRLLDTPEFDSGDQGNISVAVQDILGNVTIAKIMNLSEERNDLLKGIAIADYSLMGDTIRLIASNYWAFMALGQAVKNIRISIERACDQWLEGFQ
ncbi:hypothetical protein NB639_01230 [Oxalobacter formigenes]|uniref:hypothetical protein n=1 Tax=Oxalobacter formigenes TaxID=847 RepID=UPI0022AFF2CD|nr:hypothetical protein [Oxalobacter formigenes]WAW06054.1 hypothetical protein NB639_01230 [Oxalobacter formigenes]